MRRLFEEQVPIDEEFRLRCKNGSFRWFRGRGHAVWDTRGKPLRFAGSITDINGYKEKELRHALRLQVQARSRRFAWVGRNCTT